MKKEQPYRMDGPVDLRVKDLLFWPNNPRLMISEFKEVKYTIKQLVNPKNQLKIYDLLMKNEHGVDDLMSSMRQSGFMREKALIVMQVQLSKHLVLEGNRRLAALNSIGSIKEVPCYIFVHTSKKVPLAAAVNRLVSKHHINIGQKAHSKIQQAQMILNTYMGFLEETGKKKFFIDEGILKASADFLDFTEKEFRLELCVAHIYNQLIESNYKVDHKLRERLTWVHENPSHFKRIFGYDPNGFSLSDAGLEKYYEIFIQKGCAVHSPALFKSFLNVLRYGDSNHVEILRSDPEQLKFIEEEVVDARKGDRFVLELGRVQRKLSSLKVSEYKNSAAEKKLIGQIINLVDVKLRRLRDQDEIKLPKAPVVQNPFLEDCNSLLSMTINSLIQPEKKKPLTQSELTQLSTDQLGKLGNDQALNELNRRMRKRISSRQNPTPSQLRVYSNLKKKLGLDLELDFDDD